jgi:hypothetical protein
MPAVKKYFGRAYKAFMPFLLYAFSEFVDQSALFSDCL